MQLDRALAQRREEVLNMSRGLGVGRLTNKPSDRLAHLNADCKYAEAVAMHKFESWEAGTLFRPEAPNAELAFSHIRIMKQNDGTGAQLGKPAGEIVRNRVVRVIAIDVEQVDRAVIEIGGGLVEGHPHQHGERA